MAASGRPFDGPERARSARGAGLPDGWRSKNDELARPGVRESIHSDPPQTAVGRRSARLVQSVCPRRRIRPRPTAMFLLH